MFLEARNPIEKEFHFLFPEYLTICPGGCASRDELLERTAGPGAIDTGDNSQWGPSCNKAVREIFPESQALRKGKYKKLVVLTQIVNTSLCFRTDSFDLMNESNLLTLFAIYSVDWKEIIHFIDTVNENVIILSK